MARRLPKKGRKYEIPVGTHDYLSFFYMMRTFNLTPPKRSAISILINNKTKTLFVSAVKRETIQTRVAEYSCYSALANYGRFAERQVPAPRLDQ